VWFGQDDRVALASLANDHRAVTDMHGLERIAARVLIATVTAPPPAATSRRDLALRVEVSPSHRRPFRIVVVKRRDREGTARVPNEGDVVDARRARLAPLGSEAWTRIRRDLTVARALSRDAKPEVLGSAEADAFLAGPTALAHTSDVR